MRILQINTFPYKATGNLMMSIHNYLKSKEIESYVVWGRGREPLDDSEFSIEDKLGITWHGVFTRLTDRTGFASYKATKHLISIIDKVQPTIVHLHNIHGYYLNMELLFDYLKQNEIKVVWTLHDCWALTGHCAYFSMIKCEKWVDGCGKCPQLSTYPKSVFYDSSSWNWRKKRELYRDLDLTVVTVSKWLKGIVEKSILQKAPIYTVYNGIDEKLFCCRKSEFRKKYDIESEFVILGVASEWTARKGLEDFLELSNIIPENYRIVLVGLNQSQRKAIDKRNVIVLPRTSNLTELAEIYSSVDVYFNPSLEETMGMTTVEAMSCGTPAIVYNVTALPEILEKIPELIAEAHDLEKVCNIMKDIEKGKFSNIMFSKYAQDYSLEQQNSGYMKIYKMLEEK